MTPPKVCIWNDVEYLSVADAARANFVQPHTMTSRLGRGLRNDNDFRRGQRKPTVWNGVQYPSVRAAAQANYVAQCTMTWRLKQGYTCDDDMKW